MFEREGESSVKGSQNVDFDSEANHLILHPGSSSSSLAATSAGTPTTTCKDREQMKSEGEEVSQNFYRPLRLNSERRTHVRLDSTNGDDGWSTIFTSQRSNCYVERSVCWSLTIVGQFAMIEIPLEDDTIRAGEM